MEAIGQQTNRILNVIGIVLVITFATALHAITARIVDDRLRREFEHESSSAQLAIEARVQDYADVIFGVRALFQTWDTVSRLQFHRYVTALDLPHRYPGVRSINYAEIVAEERKATFESAVRADTTLNASGYPEFAIKPPGKRAAYHVLLYLEPQQENMASFGMDVAANPQVAASLALSRDSGKLTSSGKLIRVEGNHHHIGLAMRLPVYKLGARLDTVEDRRIAYIGSVGAGFEVQKVMEGVLRSPTFRHMQFELYDTGRVDELSRVRATTQDQLLFSSMAARNAPLAQSGEIFTMQLPMTIGGRAWESRFSASKDAMTSDVDHALPWVVFGAGLLIGFLTLNVFQSLTSSRRRAVEIARGMTKDLRESEASLADAQRMAHLGNWRLNPVSGVMTWSRETYALLGQNAADSTTDYASFLQNFDPEHRDAVQAELTSAMAGRDEVIAEHRVVHSDGTTLWVHMISRRDVSMRQVEICGTLMDVTERKRTEHAMHEKNAELEASNLAKDRFLANMSHELRTPLNAILGFTGTLLMKLPGPLSPDQEKQLQTIRSSGRHLLSLINDMLDLAKIESGKFHLNIEPLRCQDVIEEVTQTLRPLAQQKSLVFEVDLGPRDVMTLTDRRALTQILLNLVNNAIKFTENGEVKVSLKQHATDRGEVMEICIVDTGIGIRAEDQGKLFQTFTQVDASLARPFEGTGLGLYLSQKLAELMGGEITCRSEYGHGSTFTLILPIQTA